MSAALASAPLEAGPDIPPTSFAVCTVIWKNYLAHARTLFQSLRTHHPEARLFVLLADRADGYFDPSREGFEIIELEKLGIPNLPRFCFQYSPFQLNCALTPWLLAHILADHGLEKLLYLDADILVLERLDGLMAELDRSSVLLTPHLTAPVKDPGVAAKVERSMLLFGAYNAGFIGLTRSESSSQFLDWWRERVLRECLLLPAEGLYGDQRWLDLAPGLFDGVRIVRDPTYNTARWSLHSRTVSAEGDRLLIDGQPCRFFHFSGFDPRSERVAGSNRLYTFEGLGVAADLYGRYSSLLLQNGFEETIAWPQAFSVFDNGVPIPDELRLRYLGMGDEVARFGDPFRTGPIESYYQAWRREESGLRHLLTRLRRGLAHVAGRVHARLR